MSRPTTTQLIEQGNYLQPDFDPSTLTIPHIIGILAYHQIKYPSQANKAALIKIFNNEIKANHAVLLRQRIIKQEISASDNGIIDGVTGIPINPQQPLPRRSSRRLSREPSMEVQRPDPPKRRRSSAQPTIGRSTKKQPVISPPRLSEESEEEEPSVPMPVPKVVKKENSQTAGPSSRRVSQKFGPGTEESGWEDNNIFQSGAESSSPVRPPRAKTARKSSVRRSRQSLSAPPEIDSSPTQSPKKSQLFSPPQWDFAPRLPADIQKVRSQVSVLKSQFKDEYLEDNSALADISADISGEIIVEDEDEDESQGSEDESLKDDQMIDAAQSAIEYGNQLSRPLRRSVPWWQRIIVGALVLTSSGIVGQYKLESSSIGYCQRDSDTNDFLSELVSTRREIEACHGQYNEGNPDACPPLPLLPLPHPETCTPCPKHGSCGRFDVMCDDGFILSPHPLSFIPLLPAIVDGLPKLGSVAFPPSCIADEMRKKNIGALGRKIDTFLAYERGKKLCAGIDTQKPLDGGDARRWGIEIETLKDHIRKKYPREDGKSAENIDRLFGEAVDQLAKYGRIIQGSDVEGKMYLASDHVDMSWSCRAIVTARESWVEWRTRVFGVIAAVLMIMYGKAQLSVRSSENRRVSELVQIALDTLRNQELAHHTDPVTTPQPYLSSLQLRDLILQDEHSIPIRRRLWDRVERIVEGNANVRANLEELSGGEEARVWRWVGSSSLVSPGTTRVSYLKPSL